MTKKFVGKTEQTPSKYSAIKINGRKAYDLARKNIDFEMPKRTVEIYRFEILSVREKIVAVEVDCSKGTYIRTLAEDFGKSFDLPATVKFLQRRRFGDFKIENSVTPEDLKIGREKFFCPVESCLNSLPEFELPEHRVKAFCNGLSTTVRQKDSGDLRIFSGGKFLGVGKIFEGELRPVKLI